MLGPGGHGHVEVAEAVLLLAEPLEGSEEELRPHPQPPRRADVGHDLHLAQPPVLAVLLAPARLQANNNKFHISNISFLQVYEFIPEFLVCSAGKDGLMNSINLRGIM